MKPKQGAGSPASLIRLVACRPFLTSPPRSDWNEGMRLTGSCTRNYTARLYSCHRNTRTSRTLIQSCLHLQKTRSIPDPVCASSSSPPISHRSRSRHTRHERMDYGQKYMMPANVAAATRVSDSAMHLPATLFLLVEHAYT